MNIHQATPGDYREIAALMHFSLHIHRHLDWRPPLDWLGERAFWVGEEKGRVAAALACPHDPPGIAWIRLFVHSAHVESRQAWEALWPVAYRDLLQHDTTCAACVAMQEWLQTLLVESGFLNLQDIVLLDWQQDRPPVRRLPPGMQIRRMLEDDLPAVAELDAAAFVPLWQNSLETLHCAHPQAGSASVVETKDGLAAYQISTRNPFGMHLARLAVLPRYQGQGIGAALTADLIRECWEEGLHMVSVNTQSDNEVSLALYQRLGFQRTGEKYPVYSLKIPAE